jgi:hypothetical protein
MLSVPAIVIDAPAAPAVEPAVEPVKPAVDAPPTSPAPSQTATPSQPVLKSAKERGPTPSTATNPTESAAGGGRTKERDFKDCLGNWDKGTHMTKQEWRRTCERTVREYPALR